MAFEEWAGCLSPLMDHNFIHIVLYACTGDLATVLLFDICSDLARQGLYPLVSRSEPVPISKEEGGVPA